MRAESYSSRNRRALHFLFLLHGFSPGGGYNDWLVASTILTPRGSEKLRATRMDKDTARLEAFSDGVFAIAMTLLVLELKVPQVPPGLAGPYTSAMLENALRQEWPAYYSLVTSFLTVLIMWMHHHTVFKLVRHTNARLLLINGLLLLGVTIVPFSTAVVAAYLYTPAAKGACAAYSGTFLWISVVYFLLAFVAIQPRMLISQTHAAAALTRIRNSYRWGPPLYAFATFASFYRAWLCMGICTAMWIYWGVSICLNPESNHPHEAESE